MWSNTSVDDGTAPSWIRANKKIFLVVVALVVLIILDSSLIRVYDVVSKQFISLDMKMVLYATNAIAIIALGYVLLFLFKPREIGEGKKDRLHLKRIFGVTLVIHSISAAFIALLFLQTSVLSYYDTMTMLVVIVCSYVFSIVVLSIFVVRMSFVVLSKRNAIFIIMFVTALGSITVNMAVTTVSVSLRLLDRPSETRPFVGGSMDVSKGRYDALDDMYFVSSILAFATAWAASTTMMAHYARKLGRTLYWSLSASPLIFFFGQFSTSFTMFFSSLVQADPFFLAYLTTFVTSLSKPVGGLMLSIVFWAMARTATNFSDLRNHLVIAGIGILLLFTSNQALLMAVAPYPPFGLPTVAMICISAYLVVIGIYKSSISVSTDTELRKSIRNHTESRLNLLQSVISPDMIREIEKESEEIVRNESRRIAREIGIDTNLDELEMKAYLDEVARVVQAHKVSKSR